MVELYVLMTLAGIGYLLSKKTDQTADAPILVNRSELPSMNTAYDSSFLEETKRLEAQKAHNTFTRSQYAASSRVINQTYRDDQDHRTHHTVVKSNLSGVEIPMEQFLDRKVQPFFGGSVKQNVDPGVNRPVMERFTGQFGNDIYVKKSEQKPFFKPEQNVGNVYGNPVQTDYYLERMNAPKVRNNERPFEPVQVGPGVGEGFSSRPVGGYQQTDINDLVRPKTVDELRVATNPKETFAGRVVEGQGPTQRGRVGDVSKNRVETFFENTEDRYFKTTGANTRETQRPEYEVKETNRTDTSKEYKGGLYAAGFNKAQPVDGSVKDTARQQMGGYGMRNVDGENFGAGSGDDYGRNSILKTENERDLTTEKTYEGNLTSLVKSIVAPIEDIFRNSRKEYTIQNARPYGEFQRTFPEKMTIKDPNDVLRTTIKETNIHDTEAGNLRGPTKLAVYDPDVVARTTVRQTTRPQDSDLNIRGATYRGQTYQLDEAHPTMKETTIDSDRYGNIQSVEREKGGYESAEYDAKLTQKQFISDRDYIGVADRGVEGDDGYKVAKFDVPLTQKQFISDNDYVGVAEATQDKKQMSYDDAMNARLNELREGTLVGREPTKESAKVAVGGDTMNVSFRKLQVDECTERNNTNMEPITNEPVSVDTITMTKQKDQLQNDDRLDINLISPLDNNPYAQPSFSRG